MAAANEIEVAVASWETHLTATEAVPFRQKAAASVAEGGRRAGAVAALTVLMKRGSEKTRSAADEAVSSQMIGG